MKFQEKEQLLYLKTRKMMCEECRILNKNLNSNIPGLGLPPTSEVRSHSLICCQIWLYLIEVDASWNKDLHSENCFPRHAQWGGLFHKHIWSRPSTLQGESRCYHRAPAWKLAGKGCLTTHTQGQLVSIFSKPAKPSHSPCMHIILFVLFLVKA